MGSGSKLGWLGALALALGLNIGGGLWATPVIAASIGGPITIVVALLCILPVLLAAPTYITLSKTLPTSAGSYYYPTRLLAGEDNTFGQVAIWAIIWSQMAMGGFAILRTVLAAGASYLHAFFPAVSTQLFTLLLLAITFAVAWYGLEAVGDAEIVMAGLLVISLVVVLGVGLMNVDVSNLTPVAPNGTVAALSTYALVFSTIVGGLSIIDVGGEIDNPERTIGHVILFSTGATLVVCAAIVLVSVGVLPHSDLQNATLQYVTAQYLPDYLVVLSSIGALLAGLSTAIGLVPALGRWVMATAEDGILPKIATEQNRHGEPKYVIYFLVVLSTASVVLDVPLSQVVSAAALTGLGQVIPVCATGILLPSRHPELFEREGIRQSRYLSPRTVRWSAVGAVTLLTIMLVTRGMNSPQGVLWYGVFLASGVLIYFVSKALDDGGSFPRYASEIDGDVRRSVTGSLQDD